MSAALEIFSSSIVVIGDFNPAIFTPDWLEKYGLLGNADAELARRDASSVISHHATRFETDWFILQVLEQNFSLTSKGSVRPNLKDIVSGIFSLVPHTPVKALGLNFMAHYKMAHEEDYHKIGDSLAPKTVWHSIFDEASNAAGLENLTIRVQPFTRTDKTNKCNDSKAISIQPSGVVPNGVFLTMNDHHDIEKAELQENETKAEMIVRLVNDVWQSQWDESLKIFESVISKALNG